MTRREILGRPLVEWVLSVARKLWYRGRGEPITLGGHRLRFAPGTRPTRPEYRDDADLVVRNDALQMEFLCENVERGDTVVDVGASSGQYAVLCAALVGPEGHVYAFEPEPTGRELMAENLAMNGLTSRVAIEPFAVTDENAVQEFFVRPGDSMSSLQRAGFGSNAGARDIVSAMVQTVTLDEYLSANAMPNPQWLKIDAEGAEVNVLRGASRVLHGETKIICELHPYAWESFGTSFDELLGIAESAGRTVRFLDSDRDISDGPGYGAVVIT